MTCHIISVGTGMKEFFDNPFRLEAASLSDEARDKVEKARDDNELTAGGRAAGEAYKNRIGDSGEIASRWLAERLSTPRGTTEYDALAKVAARLNPPGWPKNTCAELDTFARVNATAGDRIILIATDTVRGLTSALWVALALTGDLDRVQYSSDSRNPLIAPPGHVVIARVPGMDAAHGRGFRTAMGALGLIGCDLVRGRGERSAVLGADEAVTFHLSGGFKAAIPYLIGIAEGLRTVHPNRSIEAVLLHDSSDELIELPLRRLRIDWARNELRRFDDKGRCREALPHTNLEGYAYVPHEDGGYELTAFGVGLIPLIDPGAEAIA